MKRFRFGIVGIAALGLGLLSTGSVGAAGMITAKEAGAFVLGNEVGYPAGHAFGPTIAPGTTVDSGIARVPAGGSFGWHYHTAHVVVTILEGNLALYSSTCDRQVVGAGQGFIEAPGTIHLARNEGSSVVVLAWTYLGVPAGQPEDVYEPDSYDPCGGIR
jgi:Cupin domain